MRLLEYNNDGDFSLAAFISDDIPPYGILSHRWGAEEVTFKDLTDKTGKNKTGYGKLKFCGEQARRDGLRYFWVDTCCIDKSNSTELAEAINSMFRWYRNAVKCYVYLPDVSRSLDLTDKSNEPWESKFQKSSWFTRGWTLQELIAPASVEFFSKEGSPLGSKKSLERHICQVTGIPVKALRGCPLSDFSVTERMSWAASRETTCKEDMAYSLLGIFDVNMPLIYGEGREKALKRLREEIDKAAKGIKHEDFSVTFSLSNMSDIEHFVAREAELVEMHRKLSGDGSRRIVVLHGLGGIGKTQLSAAYAKRHKDDYSAIFWLNIKDEDSLKQSFSRIAKQILRDHPSTRLSQVDTDKNIDEMVDAVKAWLSLANNTRWLMIYDNYDNPKLPEHIDPTAIDIRKFLPESYQGSIIITTRSSQVRFGHSIHIRKLEDVRDSLEILSNASRREGVKSGKDALDIFSTALNSILDPDAIKLAKELDGFPLALATAGAYLDQVAMSLFDYLRLYKESWAQLQKSSPELSSYEDRTLYSTWQISFNQVKQRNGLSAKLLCLWAYFDNQDLWFELLRHSDSTAVPEWIQELVIDELSFHSTVRVLVDYGLVEVDNSLQERVESRGYSIHGCVHSWTVHVLNQEWNYDLARIAVTFVGSHVPSTIAIRPWLTQRRLLQHAARCFHMALNGLVTDNGLGWAYSNLGLLYASQGKLVEAEQMYQRALQGQEKALGPEHTSTLRIVNNLGVLYKDQGKLVEAEQMHQRALQGLEKALGPEHTSTLGTINNLGALYQVQGKLVEAEQLWQRALQGKEKALGPEHTSTINTVNNLGILYRRQGKLVEAEQMLQRALQGDEKAVGIENLTTYPPALDTIENLGTVFKDQGNISKARTMYSKALAGYEIAYGPDHFNSERVRDRIDALDAVIKNKASTGAGEPVDKETLP